MVDQSHLAEYYAPLLALDLEQLRDDIEGKLVSIAFDGTPSEVDAVCMVVRYFDELEVRERLLECTSLRYCPEAKAMVSLRVTILLISFGTTTSDVVAFMHDRSSVNIGAMKMLTVVLVGLPMLLALRIPWTMQGND